MKKTVLSIVLTIVLFATGYSQNSLWSRTSPQKISDLPLVERSSQVQKSELFHLNYDVMKSMLQQAPNRNVSNTSNVIMAFPLADGTMANFRMFEAPVMEAELAARYPSSKSY